MTDDQRHERELKATLRQIRERHSRKGPRWRLDISLGRLAIEGIGVFIVGILRHRIVLQRVGELLLALPEIKKEIAFDFGGKTEAKGEPELNEDAAFILKEKGVAEKEVVLYRQADNKWNKLATKVVSSDANNVYYEADTPGFSYFAIGTEAAPAAEEAAAEETEEQAEEVTGAGGGDAEDDLSIDWESETNPAVEAENNEAEKIPAAGCSLSSRFK